MPRSPVPCAGFSNRNFRAEADGTFCSTVAVHIASHGSSSFTALRRHVSIPDDISR